MKDTKRSGNDDEHAEDYNPWLPCTHERKSKPALFFCLAALGPSLA
jgi:hypothetical protein